MTWTIEFAERARKSLRKLDRQVAGRIIDALSEVAALSDPRARGKRLSGNLASLWRYRIGDWRAIVKIEDDRLIIIVIEVAHRREIYDR